MSVLNANSRRFDSRSVVPASAGSLLVLLSGLLWLTVSSTYPFGPRDDYGDGSLLYAVSHTDAGWLAIGLGGLGLLTVVAMAVVRSPAPVVGGAGLQLLVLGYAVPDIQLLIVVAYLLALIVPAALLVMLAYAGLRGRYWFGWLLGLIAVGFAGWASGLLRPGSLATLGSELTSGFAAVGWRPLFLVGSVAIAAAWAFALGEYVRRNPSPASVRLVGSARAWVLRWGVAATWISVLCLLPYVLARLTWMTPWPQFAGPAELAEHPELRLWGLLLGAVALFGGWLTLGLIRRHGEVFPRWIPWLGGRAVPVMAAVVPGLSVAVVLTIAGHSIPQQGLAEGHGDALLAAVLLPMWLWGPALGVATLAYWIRRSDATAATAATDNADAPRA